MDTMDQNRIEIDDALTERIATLASEQGMKASDLAADVLRSFVEEVEGTVVADTTEDERRLREYERTGEAIPWEDFRAHLHDLIAQSRKKMRT